MLEESTELLNKLNHIQEALNDVYHYFNRSTPDILLNKPAIHISGDTRGKKDLYNRQYIKENYSNLKDAIYNEEIFTNDYELSISFSIIKDDSTYHLMIKSIDNILNYYGFTSPLYQHIKRTDYDEVRVLIKKMEYSHENQAKTMDNQYKSFYYYRADFVLNENDNKTNNKIGYIIDNRMGMIIAKDYNCETNYKLLTDNPTLIYSHLSGINKECIFIPAKFNPKLYAGVITPMSQRYINFCNNIYSQYNKFIFKPYSNFLSDSMLYAKCEISEIRTCDTNLPYIKLSITNIDKESFITIDNYKEFFEKLVTKLVINSGFQVIEDSCKINENSIYLDMILPID